MKRTILALVAVAVLISAPARAKSFSTIILYKNSQVPLQGNPQRSWAWHENALTASTQRLPADLLRGAVLIDARAIIVWNPNTAIVRNGVILVACDDGPANCTTLAVLTGVNNAANGPTPHAFDITLRLQSIINGGVHKNLGFETLGNGTTGPLMYEVAIECVWR